MNLEEDILDLLRTVLNELAEIRMQLKALKTSLKPLPPSPSWLIP